MTNILYEFFDGIEKDYLASGMNKKLEKYISDSIQYSIVIAIFIGVLSFIFILIISIKLIKHIIPFLFIAPIFLAILSFAGLLYLFKIYPKFLKNERERKIDNSLYFAVLYMASLTSSGANPKVLFDLLSKYKDFSEIQKESQRIIYLVDDIGLSLPDALKNRIDYSPSKKWASILEGIRSIIIEGGDLESYLYQQVEKLYEEYKRKIIEYSDNLQIFLEIYITLIVVGIIFLIVLTTLMGSIANTSFQSIESLQLISVLTILPMGTLMFIILIKSMNPFET